jgi:hypothetical protein
MTVSRAMDESELYQPSDSEISGTSSASYTSNDEYTPFISDPETDQYSESGSMEDDEVQLPPSNLRKRRHQALQKTHSNRQHRSIIASMSISRAQETTHVNHPLPFTFLEHECYSCSCHQSPSDPKRCAVLNYFRLKFIKSWTSIFCPDKNRLIPASRLEHYINKNLNGAPPKAREQSKDMANHIVLSCSLVPEQSGDDIKSILPDELDGPLIDTGIFHSFKCPLCDNWAARDRSGGPADRNIRRHIAEKHEDQNLDADIERPRWTYRVQIDGSPSHVFALPLTWAPRDIQNNPELDPLIPDLDLQAQSSVAIYPTQDWPLRLDWESYAAEINASTHIQQLRTLIGPSKLVNDGSQTYLLESGLRYVRGFCIKYIKGSGTLATESTSHLGRVLVSRCVTTMFAVHDMS